MVTNKSSGFSDTGTGAPQATIGLELRNGAWHPDQARGPKNADPGPEMLEVGHELLTRYRTAAVAA